MTGQSLVFDAPEGRASSVTSVTVFEATTDDDGTSEAATTGSAAVETNPNTTFDAASGDGQADPRKCNLTATTGITAGRRYLATNTTGEKELVEVAEIASADYVIARNPLRNAYVSTNTFVSTRISISIDSTWVAAETNISQWLTPNPRYRVRWVYVVGGVTYVHATFFDLVRYRGDHTVVGLDVDRRFPGWLDSLPTQHREDQGAAIIAEAYRLVKLDLYHHGKADQMARNMEVIDHLVVLRAFANSVQAQVASGGSMDVAAWALGQYQGELQHLIAQPKIEFDVSSGGASTTVTPLPVWRL